MSSDVFRVRDVLHDPLLVSRACARELAEPLATKQRAGEVTIDFEGVAGISPSFLDELVGVLHETIGIGARMRFVNQPARFSLKFEAVARGRGMSVRETGPGEWTFEPTSAPTPPPTRPPS